jgi:hypothetical protein
VRKTAICGYSYTASAAFSFKFEGRIVDRKDPIAFSSATKLV